MYTNNDDASWTLTGTDALLFSITSGGVLSFNSAPDFEVPGDDNGDNDKKSQFQNVYI